MPFGEPLPLLYLSLSSLVRFFSPSLVVLLASRARRSSPIETQRAGHTHDDTRSVTISLTLSKRPARTTLVYPGVTAAPRQYVASHIFPALYLHPRLTSLSPASPFSRSLSLFCTVPSALCSVVFQDVWHALPGCIQQQ